MIKIIGLGIEKYFNDNWNKFDFSMIIISLASSVLYRTFIVLRSVKSAKSVKILRLTKINIALRIFRALRTIRVVKILIVGADTLS